MAKEGGDKQEVGVPAKGNMRDPPDDGHVLYLDCSNVTILAGVILWL